MPLIHTAHVEVRGVGQTTLTVLRKEVDPKKHLHRWLVKIKTQFSSGLNDPREVEIMERVPLIAAYNQVFAEIEDIHKNRDAMVVQSTMDFYIVAPRTEPKKQRKRRR